MKVGLGRAVASLTSALDFVGVDEVHHGKRVALMAAAVATELGWSTARSVDMLYAGMIHDCGVSRMREHRQISETLEWEGADEHCRRGEAFLLACPPLARFAPIVRWHHTRWEALPAELAEETRLAANLIFMVDRADVLLAPFFSGASLKNEILWEYPKVFSRIAGLAGRLFSPELVEAFGRASSRESFLLAMDPSYIEDEVEQCLGSVPEVELDAADALAVARLFACTVDAKSRYTLDHSIRVARIACHLAKASGIVGEALDLIEIAALLHDIGKLRVPEEIIDKPGALSREERALVTRHSYDTWHILRQVFPGQPIAEWAAMHHENLLGTGYPFHSPARAIPREARLISVADIFQALAQDRPYRRPLDCAEVMRRVEEFRSQGRVDPEMVDLLRSHLDACFALAVE